MNNVVEEVWKDIEGYEGIYQGGSIAVNVYWKVRESVKKKKATYQMTYDQIEAERRKSFDDGFRKGKDDSFDLMVALPMIILRDKYGFGATRLEKFTDYMIEVFDSIHEGYVSFDDLLNALKDETGIDIRKQERR